MKKIYEYYEDFGSMGEVDGVFIADSELMDKLNGVTVVLDEVLGEHSYLEGKISEETIKEVTGDQDFIAKFEDVMGENYSSGLNPLNHLSISEVKGLGLEGLV